MAHIETVSLNPEGDRDIIEYLGRIEGSKSAAWKAALRMYMRYKTSLDPQALVDRLDKLDQVEEQLATIKALAQEIKAGLKSGLVHAPQGEIDNTARRKAMSIMDQMEEL
jgi:hypothetical protein